MRKCFLQRGNDMALPAGMEVEVDFIDQDYPCAIKWVFPNRIGDSHPASEVAHHGEGALFTIRELINPEFFAALVQDHTQWSSSYLEAVETGKESFDGCSYRV